MLGVLWPRPIFQSLQPPSKIRHLPFTWAAKNDFRCCLIAAASESVGGFHFEAIEGHVAEAAGGHFAAERRVGSGAAPSASGFSSGTQGVVGGYPGFVCGRLAMFDRCSATRSMMERVW